MRTNTTLTLTERFLNESVRRKSPSECIWDNPNKSDEKQQSDNKEENMEKAKKKETMLFADKQLVIDGKTFDVRLFFPSEKTESVSDKLMCLVTGKTRN